MFEIQQYNIININASNDNFRNTAPPIFIEKNRIPQTDTGHYLGLTFDSKDDLGPEF